MKLKNAKILIVDDDPDVLVAMKMLLQPEVKELVTEKNPENLNALISRNNFDLIILDMNFKSALNTGNEGFFWLNKIREQDKEALVIMITAYGDINLAIRSLKEGASDFVVKPWRNEKLIEVITEALGKTLNSSKPNQGAIQVNEKPVRNGTSKENESLTVEIIGDSEAMQEVFFKIDKIGPTDANVLILGENGTGKDLVARALHERSLRKDKPYIAVDLGALTETLFESELFGHRKGAFTDAREDRTGRIEAASGGTLFLDEIGNISLYQQAKLLSVLQNRHIVRLGTNQMVPVDIRLICATNVPIYELASEARFRKDLIYRINTVEITLPPLRKRGNDIELLARHFLKIYTTKYNKSGIDFETAALIKLKQYNWPGNVRELQHTIERAVIMAGEGFIRAHELSFSPIEHAELMIDEPKSFQLHDIEKDTILKAIEKHQGNISKAARELGITRTALYRRLNKYDI
ncbi:sigma-54-dependent Fis family transcriptional regulator [Solitalea longa]|uniref:Sigma-54-dependent Fis family transcriptional regulator n=1 Tax=Solitalea longa TaxID=2079460 RepID=A0A2S5A8I4_9SPHI|nr:sigma-54 dependent transcriptional regulator [Solitalea longa]POY38567.1 sigma-54-dependent Fis family transcriptional regulator [Solitalea longa]